MADGFSLWINRTRTVLATAGKSIRELVFPDKCLHCGIYISRAPDIPLSACFCPACMGRSLPFYAPPFCFCCGKLHGSGIREDIHLCEACLKQRPALDRVRAAFEYKGIIREALGLFKYQSRLSLARPFETHLFQALEAYFAHREIHVILPIPLHPRKARKRGFNQSYLLVRRFSSLYTRKYGRPAPWSLDVKSLARVRFTPSQTGLDIRQREENLDRAFEWRSKQALTDKAILLVDDVYTTGATCNAAAKILKEAGAARVNALVLARA